MNTGSNKRDRKKSQSGSSTREINVFCSVATSERPTFTWTVNGVAPGSGVTTNDGMLSHRFSAPLQPNPTVYNCTATQVINNMTRVFSRAARVTASGE